jgi:hypothetical protein
MALFLDNFGYFLDINWHLALYFIAVGAIIFYYHFCMALMRGQSRFFVSKPEKYHQQG